MPETEVGRLLQQPGPCRRRHCALADARELHAVLQLQQQMKQLQAEEQGLVAAIRLAVGRLQPKLELVSSSSIE
ncbi:hypothetical protein CKO25_17760 [Thiocapsa imhoffii]|uniref:Uncharacterized protein n=1 Tax=Thiocapsa imhoffii TaxID=382777 RepID=A0A9X1BA00_9GAMM|nr:hypothetical protein [Thiocapsa imhoffii]